MRKLVLFLLVYTCSFQPPMIPCRCTNNLVRQKRGVLDLAVTLWCYRNRLKVPLLGINLYGCYCGPGGSGTPVDDVDRCCLQHDCCYRYSRLDLQCHSKIKWQFYHFSCGRSYTECRSPTLCGRMACECERQFAECLTKAKPRKKHFFYSKAERCLGHHDACPQMHPDLMAILHQNLTTTDNTMESWIQTAKSRRKRWMKKSNKRGKWKDVRGSPLWI